MHTLQLGLKPRAGASLTISLELMTPAAWSERSDRAWAALPGPPPLPPRLG
jgi:hypothetical protein